MRNNFLLSSALLIFIYNQIYAQFEIQSRYNIQSYLYTDMTLDIINDGYNNQVILDKIQNVSGQYWKLSQIEGMLDYYRLTPDFQQSKALDVINDNKDNKVWLDRIQNVTGQYWKITQVNGTKDIYRLSPYFQPSKSLEVMANGKGKKVWLNKTNNIKKQFWKIKLVK